MVAGGSGRQSIIILPFMSLKDDYAVSATALIISPLVDLERKDIPSPRLVIRRVRAARCHLLNGVLVKLRQEGRVRGGVDEVVLRGVGRGRVDAGRGDVRRLPRRHLLGVETGSSGRAALAGARFRRVAAGGCEAAPAANEPLAFLLR